MTDEQTIDSVKRAFYFYFKHSGEHMSNALEYGIEVDGDSKVAQIAWNILDEFKGSITTELIEKHVKGLQS